MHILILIDTLSFGGAEKQAVNDANALSRKGLSVSVAYFTTGSLVEELLPKIITINIDQESYHSKIIALIRIIKGHKIDLIHAHMFRAEIVAAIAGRITGALVVFNEHGLGLWRKWYHRFVFRLASMFSHKVLCASDACRHLRLQLEMLPTHKLKTVYNSFKPFPIKSINNSKLTLSEKIFSSLDIKEMDFIFIGYVGRFDTVKRLNLFIDLAKNLREDRIIFILVGDGNDRNRIKRLIKREGLEHHFYLPGFVHNPREYYELFDIFILPSKRESMSLALIEAGGYAIPAVAFDVGGNREVIAHGETGFLLADGDHEGLVCRVRELVEDRELRAVTGKNARAWMLAQFSESRRIANLISIYQQLCNR